MNFCKNFFLPFSFILLFLFGTQYSANIEIVKIEKESYVPFQYLPIELNNAIFSSFLTKNTDLRLFLDLRTINKRSNKFIDAMLADYTTLNGMVKHDLSAHSLFYKDLLKLAVKINYVTNIEKILNGDAVEEEIPLLYTLIANKDCCVNKLFGLQAYDFFDNIDSVNDQGIIQPISSEITYITDENKITSECPVSLVCIDGNNDKATVLEATRFFAQNSISTNKTRKVILFQPANDTVYLEDIQEMFPYSFIVKQQSLKKPDSVLICEARQPNDYVENNGDINKSKQNSTKKDLFDGSYIDYSYVFLYQDSSNNNATLLNLLLFPSWCLQRSEEKWSSFYNNCFKWLANLYPDNKEKMFCKIFFPYEKSFDDQKLFEESLNLFCQSNKKFETSLLLYGSGPGEGFDSNNCSPHIQTLNCNEKKWQKFYYTNRHRFVNELETGTQWKENSDNTFLKNLFDLDCLLADLIERKGNWSVDRIAEFLVKDHKKYVNIFLMRNDLKDQFFEGIARVSAENQEKFGKFLQYVANENSISNEIKEDIFVYIVENYTKFKFDFGEDKKGFSWIKENYNKKVLSALWNCLLTPINYIGKIIFDYAFQNDFYRIQILENFFDDEGKLFPMWCNEIPFSNIKEIFNYSCCRNTLVSLFLQDYEIADTKRKRSIEYIFQYNLASLNEFDFCDCSNKYPDLGKAIIKGMSIESLCNEIVTCPEEKRTKFVKSIFELITVDSRSGSRNFEKFFTCRVEFKKFLKFLTIEETSYLLNACERCSYTVSKNDLLQLKLSIEPKPIYKDNKLLIFDDLATFPLPIAKYLIENLYELGIDVYFENLHLVSVDGIRDKRMRELYYEYVLKWRRKDHTCCEIWDDMSKRNEYFPEIVTELIIKCDDCAKKISNSWDDSLKNACKEGFITRIKNNTNSDERELLKDAFKKIEDQSFLNDIDDALFDIQCPDFFIEFSGDRYGEKLLDSSYKLTEQDVVFLKQNRGNLIEKISNYSWPNDQSKKTAELLYFLSVGDYLKIGKNIDYSIKKFTNQNQVNLLTLRNAQEYAPELVLQLFQYSITNQKLSALSKAKRSLAHITGLNHYLINNTSVKMLLPVIRYYQKQNISPVDYVNFESPFFKSIVLLLHFLTYKPILTLCASSAIIGWLLFHYKRSAITKQLGSLLNFLPIIANKKTELIDGDIVVA